MKKHYPIMLQLEGKKVVVVGGGKVAERKVSGLLDTGATITVISPGVTNTIHQLALEGAIVWQESTFTKEDLIDAFMIFAATDDSVINQLVKNTAAVHQLVSLVDDPEDSDFHVPANFTRGRLSISVSTGGASPMLAGRIRAQLEDQFDEAYEGYLEFLYSARQRILKEVKDPSIRRNLLTAIVSEDFLNREGREEKFKRLLEKD